MLKRLLLGTLFLTALPFALNAHDGEFPTDSLENPSLQYFSAELNVGFESAYVFRGEQLANSSVQPSLNMAYEVLGFDLYTEIWSNVPTDSNSFTDLEVGTGLAYSYGMLSLDAGFRYYDYDGDNLIINRMWEAYVGASIDTASILDGINLNPSLYYIYNFTQESHIIEASLFHELQIGEMLFGEENLTIPLAAKLGYLSSSRREGDQVQFASPDSSASWLYLTLSADICYKFSENIALGAGVRFTERFSENYSSIIYASRGACSNVYFGTKLTFSF